MVGLFTGRRRANRSLIGPTELTSRAVKAIFLFAQTLALSAVALMRPSIARAGDDFVVPAAVQVRLLANVAGYDRNMANRVRTPTEGRPANELRIGIVLRPKHASSAQAAGQLRHALKSVGQLAGFSHQEEELSSMDPAEIAQHATHRGWAILYLMPGFSEEDVHALARALEATDLLTVAAAASDARGGMVLGFDLVSSKPRLIVHLRQARRQRVDFSSQLLSLSEVVE
jgi:hypothetical protein